MEICKETSQSDVVPIVGLIPSSTTVLGEKLALPLVVVFDDQDKTCIVIYYKTDDFFQFIHQICCGTCLNLKIGLRIV